MRHRTHAEKPMTPLSKQRDPSRLSPPRQGGVPLPTMVSVPSAAPCSHLDPNTTSTACGACRVCRVALGLWRRWATGAREYFVVHGINTGRSWERDVLVGRTPAEILEEAARIMEHREERERSQERRQEREENR